MFVMWLVFIWLFCVAWASLLAPRWVYSIRKTFKRAEGIVMDEEPSDLTVGLIRVGGGFTFFVLFVMWAVWLNHP